MSKLGKTEGLGFIYRMMEEENWDEIDIKTVEIIMDTVFVLENPYDLVNPLEKNGSSKSEGIELLHKIISRHKSNKIRRKDLEVMIVAVSRYEKFFPKK